MPTSKGRGRSPCKTSSAWKSQWAAFFYHSDITHRISSLTLVLLNIVSFSSDYPTHKLGRRVKRGILSSWKAHKNLLNCSKQEVQESVVCPPPAALALSQRQLASLSSLNQWIEVLEKSHHDLLKYHFGFIPSPTSHSFWDPKYLQVAPPDLDPCALLSSPFFLSKLWSSSPLTLSSVVPQLLLSLFNEFLILDVFFTYNVCLILLRDSGPLLTFAIFSTTRCMSTPLSWRVSSH